MTLLRAREAVMRHFRASLRRFDITEQQWRVLRALATIDQIEVTELARATFLLPPSLSRIIRDLEQRELITRRSAENDMRRAIVAISPKGLTLIEMVSPQSESIYAEISRLFGETKLNLLQDMLRELEQRMLETAPIDDEISDEEAQALTTGRPRGRPRKRP
jgi:homoprotocatechuate degradation regulator HpaR